MVGTIGARALGGFTSGPGGDAVFVARFTAGGSLDPAFGIGGVVRLSTLPGSTAPPGSDNIAFDAVALDAAGNIVVAGSIYDPGGIVARFTPSGALDPSFGGSGWVSSGTLWRGLAVAVRPDTGAIVVSGDGPADAGAYAYGFGVQQFRPDGSIDTSFNGTGTLIYTFPNPSGNQPARGLALGPGGEVVLSGWITSASHPVEWGVVRIQPSSSLTALGASPAVGIPASPGSAIERAGAGPKANPARPLSPREGHRIAPPVAGTRARVAPMSAAVDAILSQGLEDRDSLLGLRPTRSRRALELVP